MNIVRVTKEFSFEMAHALDQHDGKCQNIHGHSYKLSVTIRGNPVNDSFSPKNGMVIDFSDLKSIVNKEIIEPLDHGLMLYEKSDLLNYFDGNSDQQIIIKPYNPTCENMVADFAELLEARLPKEVELHSLKLRETKTSYAEWYQDDNR